MPEQSLEDGNKIKADKEMLKLEEKLLTKPVAPRHLFLHSKFFLGRSYVVTPEFWPCEFYDW